MDITQIGFNMIVMVGFIVTGYVVSILTLAMGTLTIKAYLDRDIKVLVTMAVAWSFLIGSALTLIGSVYNG